MANKLFVGGFPYEITPEALTQFFTPCGKVLSVRLIMDRETGRPKGFGFIEMGTDAEAQAAVAKLNGVELGGRKIFVTEARPEGKPAAGPAAAPGFVERRSGKDRRRSAAPVGERRDAPAGEKKWEKKPWEKKPWEKKTWDKKPGGFGDKKPWEKKPWDKKPGEKKPWDKKPGEKKPWDNKPGEKKPWDKKPEGKPWEKKKPWDNKPGGVEGGKKWEKKPVQFKRFGPKRG